MAAAVRGGGLVAGASWIQLAVKAKADAGGLVDELIPRAVNSSTATTRATADLCGLPAVDF
jgi:hypothetical protein